MATEFIAKVVTPEGIVFEKPVTFLKIRTENGDIGILAKHINFISPIGVGEMLVREKENVETSYFLQGGFLEVRQDKVVVIGEEVLEVSQAEAIRLAKQKAIAVARRNKIREEQDILGTKKRIQSNLMNK